MKGCQGRLTKQKDLLHGNEFSSKTFDDTLGRFHLSRLPETVIICDVLDSSARFWTAPKKKRRIHIGVVAKAAGGRSWVTEEMESNSSWGTWRAVPSKILYRRRSSHVVAARFTIRTLGSSTPVPSPRWLVVTCLYWPPCTKTLLESSVTRLPMYHRHPQRSAWLNKIAWKITEAQDQPQNQLQHSSQGRSTRRDGKQPFERRFVDCRRMKIWRGGYSKDALTLYIQAVQLPVRRFLPQTVECSIWRQVTLMRGYRAQLAWSPEGEGPFWTPGFSTESCSSMKIASLRRAGVSIPAVRWDGGRRLVLQEVAVQTGGISACWSAGAQYTAIIGTLALVAEPVEVFQDLVEGKINCRIDEGRKTMGMFVLKLNDDTLSQCQGCSGTRFQETKKMKHSLVVRWWL